MADNDRYRQDQDRFRRRDDDGRGRYDTGGRHGADYEDRSDDGYIAQRGFGNERAGYDRGRPSWAYEGSRRDPSMGRDQSFRRDQDYGRERDFGDSAGYGGGGSARDWRDVMGEDRNRGSESSAYGYDRSHNRGYAGGSGAGGDYGRTGSSNFGRGSREDQDDRGFFERAGDEIRSWFGDDDRQGGSQHHRGRGPRNYTRSDDRIRDDVNDRLTDDPHIDASDIEVSVSNREVTLSGHVASRFEKRHAEDLAESVSGVAHVQNNLRVRQSNALAGMGGSSSTMTSDMGSEAEGSGTRTDRGGSATGQSNRGGGPRKTPAI
jgi:osmotically-inducible protein OsmY